MNISNGKRSKTFYIKVTGSYALWTDPATKGGGERVSMPVPTRQALQGIIDACYFKPTIKNIVDEVKIVNPIRFSSIGYRALYGNNSPGLNYVTVLEEVIYFVKFWFEWNEAREDLMADRNMNKHEAIMERSLKKGGRRDIFLGAREFVGFVEEISQSEYDAEKTAYYGTTVPLGRLFHSFKYPEKSGGLLESYFTDTIMTDGIVKFKPQSECEVKNELSSYTFKTGSTVVSVDTELKEYGKDG